MRPFTTTVVRAVGAIWLTIAGSANGQTATAVADTRGGSVVAATSPESAASASYVITPRSLFMPINFNQTVTDGGASASLSSQSQWLNLGPGNVTTGFTAKGSLGVSLGAVSGTAIADDYIQVQLEVSGLAPDATWLFSFVGTVTNTFSGAAVTLVGPGVNLAYGSEAEWGTLLELVNGTYTLTIDATSLLIGTGPDIGALDYDVRLERALPPGEVCESALPVSVGVTLVSTIGNTGESLLPSTCQEGYGLWMFNDAFFTLDGTADCAVTVHTCGPNTNFDTRLAVYTGSCGDLTLIACNDDSPQCGILSSVTFPCAAGERYVIQLGSYDGSTGTADLSISQSGFNGECEQAAPIFEGITTVSTAGMTGRLVLPDICAASPDEPNTIYSDAFFLYEATASNMLTIKTCGPNTTFDTRLAVYTGTCDDLALVACNDDGEPTCGSASVVSFLSVSGETYLIQLGSYDGSTGIADLSVTQSGACLGPCPADLDRDGVVAGADMGVLLGQWGGAGSGDIDCSGLVDAADLAVLLGAWGACP